ncbi:hypothetical protein BP6252_10271 [Coleophoma cylindrospora]|uniref:Alpha-L-rhamnosidase six-hairpin glycosidase domain-containing protein n=1 Tax=Coleophoma cylindrospora TaxID=1849047 RepID=A0A3D8QSJ8_9HELO|nr:hypothetical protein BP6252_10271 [Coleophoma cylindrospora]
MPVNPFQKFQITASVPVATIDYGSEVAGYPYFNVESVSGKVQIEVKYSEQFDGLSSNFSDGPFPIQVALSNTYRVETFEITSPGEFQAYLLQGGQRWQSIRLLTDGTVTFSAVGFKASVQKLDINNLPGSFQSDDDNLNEIWKLGARAASMACVEKGSQKAIWDVSDDGAFVRGMRAGISFQGAFFKDYTLEFTTKIERGGIGWAIAHPIASPAKGIQLNLVGNQPANTSFVNTNTSLTPPNSILLAYGYSFVNVTTLTSYMLDTFNVPQDIQENTWYTVKSVLSGDYLAVSINNTQVFNVSLSSYYIGGTSIPTAGSFGFGGWQDQSGYIKDVSVYSTANGTALYQNSMTNSSVVLAEYGVHENFESICLDGAKRDRTVWLGDYYHTSRIIGASTSAYDIARGTLQFFLDWQLTDGVFPYDPPIGYDPSTASNAFATGGGGQLAGYEIYDIILPDYQILGMISFCNYVITSGDLTFASQTWAQWKLHTEWVLSWVSPTIGLPVFTLGFLGPGNSSSAISCALIQVLNMMADVATGINDTASALSYRSFAENITTAVNSLLWNPDLGVYSVSPASPNDFSVASIAFCITSGAANSTQVASSLAALPSLQLGPGYKDSTTVNSSDPSALIAPNTNGFLLSALLSQNQSNTALALIKSLWTPMISNNETSSGASWEYMGVIGDPGYGLFTSLSHPWGGAPTYLLTEWVAGLRSADGAAGIGYKNWIIGPEAGIAMNLKNVTAKVVTAFGGSLEVDWNVQGTTMNVNIQAPNTTSGVFVLGKTKKVLQGESSYSFSFSIS